MPRRGNVPKREILPDPIYGSVLVTKLVNSIMLDGKKGVAQKVVYGAFDIVKEKTGNERMILSREQQEEIAKLRKAQADTSRQLKNVRKELTSGIDSLGVFLKALNILAVPLFIVAFGIFRGVRRRRR